MKKIWLMIIFGLFFVKGVTIFLFGLFFFLEPQLGQFSVQIQLLIVLTGMFGGVLWWGFMSTRWQVLAFKTVEEEDWAQLLKLAHKTYLIVPFFSVLNRAKIVLPGDNQFLAEIDSHQSEIEQVEVVNQHFLAPEVIHYYVNNGWITVTIIARCYLLLCCVVGIIIAPEDEWFFVLSIPVILLSYRNYRYWKYWNFTNVGLTLDQDALLVHTEPTVKIFWDEIDKLSISDQNLSITTIKGEVTIVDLYPYKIVDYDVFFRRIKVILIPLTTED